jgi:hypothetical protein
MDHRKRKPALIKKQMDFREPGKTAEKILTAARKVFAENGYSGKHVDEIAARAGVNKVTLYANVIHQVLGNVAQDIAKSVAKADNPEEKLKTYINCIAFAVDENPEIPPIMMREMASGGTHLPRVVAEDMTSLVIAREYEDGTMETIKSLPIHAGEFLLGKSIPYFFIGLANASVQLCFSNYQYAAGAAMGDVFCARTWYNPNIESQHFFVPGIVAFVIMLISLLLTSIAVIREKEAGTMEQIIVTLLKSYEFILGKTIPYIILSLLQLTVVIIAACLFLLGTLGIGLDVLWHQYLLLAVLGTIVFAGAIVRFKKRLD